MCNLFKKLIITVGLWLLLSTTALAQGAPTLCEGVIYKEVAKGSTVTLCFDFPDEDRPKVKYFRVRRSQTPAGAYLQFMRLTPDTTTFQFTATVSCHIFVTTVWDETQPDGTVITRESPGSNHVQILVE